MPTSPAAKRPNTAAGETTPRITHAMEDYLKAAFRLEQEGGTVTTQRLADELGISGPSVTNMVKRLNELRMLAHTPYHGVRLTPAGEKIALEVLRHHRLLELYLSETLGYSWDEVHAEAERLEHHLSDALEARLDSALGHPTVDPHGDPIPSREGVLAPVPETRLLDLAPGERAAIARVSDRDPAQLRYLGELGLFPGVAIELIETLPFDGPVRVRTEGGEFVLGRPLAGTVHVEREVAP